MLLLFLALFFISVLRVILRIWLITLIVTSPIGDIFWWAFVRLLLLLSAVTLILLFGGFVLLVSFRSFLLLGFCLHSSSRCILLDSFQV